MILPTYACNLDCWYCLQRHRNLRLIPDSVCRIKRHISRYVEDNCDLNELQLSWFGGEPLLAFDEIVEISSYAMDVCQKRGIRFANTITTNATLLTHKKVELLRSVNMGFFQITLDGSKVEHDKVKSIPSVSAYEQTLSNINIILTTIPSAVCAVRFNYTAANLNPDEFMEDITARIGPDLRERVMLSFKKVWQVDEKDIPLASLDSLYGLAKQKHFRTDVYDNFSMCYVENKHFNTIFPNCSVDKCDNLDPDNARGHIEEDGTILWKEPLPYKAHTPYTAGESDCRECKYLPVCNGPCPAARDSMWQKSGRIKCVHKYPDLVCSERIIRYCEGSI